MVAAVVVELGVEVIALSLVLLELEFVCFIVKGFTFKKSICINLVSCCQFRNVSLHFILKYSVANVVMYFE